MNNPNLNLESHYAKLADIYDDLWFYSDDFVSHISSETIKRLDLLPDDKFVDLGCGTGIYAKEIQQTVKFNTDVICSDFSSDMLAQIPKGIGLKTVHMDSIDFVLQPINYSKIFIKEMVHHIDDKERLFRGVFNQLEPKGKFLLLLLPPTIDYPLFQKAISLYEKHQPHYQGLDDLLTKIGFETKVDFINYQLEIEKEIYFTMVKERYMSLLSSFSDEEINIGLEEMSIKYETETVLKFSDRFVAILSSKN